MLKGDRKQHNKELLNLATKKVLDILELFCWYRNSGGQIIKSRE